SQEERARHRIEDQRASMRPRHKASDHGVLVDHGAEGQLASMRPRHKASDHGYEAQLVIAVVQLQ
ncbi:MAG: hypothetical protein KGL18_01960, partial [Burkholderiales bacterium]|nr:hypothetical protein [Burkholderiales bacterium]